MTKTVTVTIIDDDEVEPTEAIKCLLSNPRGTELGIPHETRILLDDNDGGGMYVFVIIIKILKVQE